MIIIYPNKEKIFPRNKAALDQRPIKRLEEDALEFEIVKNYKSSIKVNLSSVVNLVRYMLQEGIQMGNLGADQLQMLMGSLMFLRFVLSRFSRNTGLL